MRIEVELTLTKHVLVEGSLRDSSVLEVVNSWDDLKMQFRKTFKWHFAEISSMLLNTVLAQHCFVDVYLTKLQNWHFFQIC